MGLRGGVSSSLALLVCLLLSVRHTDAAEDARLGVPVGGLTTDQARQVIALPDTAGTTTRLNVTAGVGETDNVTRSSGGDSQTVGVVGVDFGLKRTGRRLDADLRGDFDYLDYLQGAYGSQLAGRFDGTAGWTLIQEHLRWVLDDSFGQAQLSPFAAVTPDNLEKINVVSTGPDLVLRPAHDFFVKLSARYAYAHYETSPFDNHRLVGSLAVGHDISARSSVALNTDFQRIRFNDTTVNTDYDRRNFYGTYTARGARTALSVDLGASQTDDLGTYRTTPFARFEVTRELSTTSMLKLIAGRQYSDASDSFRSLQGGASGRIVVSPVIGTTASYLDQYATVLWSFERSRTKLDVSGSYERDTYEADAAQDVSRASIELRAARRLTSILTLELSGRAGRERYLQAGLRDHDYLASIGLGYRAGRRLDFKLRYDHESRSASDASGYTENQILLAVGYSVLP